MYGESRKSRALHFNIFRFLTYSILLFLITFLLSCADDNPVKPKETTTQIIDSSIFNWQFVNCDGYVLNDIYVLDTNKVFFASLPNLTYFDGLRLVDIASVPPYYFPQKVAGCDANNIFFGGFFYSGPESGVEKLWVKKWNGSGFQSIPVLEDTLRSGITDIYVNNGSDVWIAEDPSRLLHYDGFNVTSYHLQTEGELLRSFFKDVNGDFYIGGTTGLDTSNWSWRYDLWKWVPPDWMNVVSDTVIFIVSPMQDGTYVCGTDYVRSGMSSFYYLKTNSWAFLQNTPGFTAEYASGISKSYFICSTMLTASSPHELMLYNGFQWLKQTNFRPPNGNLSDKIKPFKMFRGYCIGCFENNLYYNNFYIGRPK
jgi:hypothetical protein